MIAGLAGAGCVAAFLLPPLSQPLEYHRFADRRTFLEIPNSLDTVSNLAFLIPGIWGLWALWRKHDRIQLECAPERVAYTIVFMGAALTCFGSAWYHLSPDNSGLFWDRLPMTIVFTSLLGAVIGERISARALAFSLGPLLIAGAASVLYWRWTEAQGQGNLWPYAAAQYLSLAVILLLIWFFPSRYTHDSGLAVVIALYALAKVAEAADRTIFRMAGIVSGHTLKHLIAAYAAWALVNMLRQRTVQSRDAE
jgi:hypothetical protein